MDDTDIQQRNGERFTAFDFVGRKEKKYFKCDYCGMLSQFRGKCPHCSKGYMG